MQSKLLLAKPPRYVGTDKLGMFFAGLCLSHCILTPIAYMLLGSNIIFATLKSHWFHIALLVPILIIALFSFPKTWQLTNSRFFKSLVVFGALALLLAQTIGHDWEMALTISGSIMLMIAHYLSLRIRYKHSQHSK